MKRIFRNLQKCKNLIYLIGLILFFTTKINAQFTVMGPLTDTISPKPITVNNISFGRGRGINNNSSIAIGQGALSSNVSGSTNIAIGVSALSRNTTGSANIAIGENALNDITSVNSNTGQRNIAIGENSIFYNSSGFGNTAVGFHSLQFDSVGNYNIAMGYGCLALYKQSKNNTAIGYSALGGSLSGPTTNNNDNNCVFGFQALDRLASGTENIAIGSNALHSSTDFTGSKNVVIGSGTTLLSGSNNNIAIGYGTALPSGDNNVIIGSAITLPSGNSQLSIQNIIYGVNNSATGTTPSTGSIGIGTNTGFTYSGTNNGQLGGPTPATGSQLKLVINGWTASIGFLATSDQRLKKNLRKIDNPIEKITKITGYTYNWNKEYKTTRQLDDFRQAGFLAQEIEKVLPEAVVKMEDGIFGLNYNAIMPLLAEGIKAQQEEIKALQLDNENFKLQIIELTNKLNQLAPNDVKINVNSLEVIPNPITGTSVVSYKLNSINGASILVIADLQGKILKQISLPKNIKDGQVQVNKKELANGMYIFSLISGNTEIQSKKVLVSE